MMRTVHHANQQQRRQILAAALVRVVNGRMTNQTII